MTNSARTSDVAHLVARKGMFSHDVRRVAQRLLAWQIMLAGAPTVSSAHTLGRAQKVSSLRLPERNTEATNVLRKRSGAS